MASCSQRSFSAHRDNLAETLRTTGDRTCRHPVTYKWISRFLANRADELINLKEIAASSKRPDCFLVRCDRIITEMKTQSLMFKIGKNISTSAPRLMEMYALAVGRLTLSYSGRDQYAEEEDEEAMERRFERQPQHAENADRLTSVVCDLDSFWLRLNWPVDGCYCSQCEKRRPFMN
ncbi:hypothetical protein N7481_013174 [Penicillium waksmanii]|uniref:uncharacterized protein n=1 Tax=Penicillium waksmanii TaxID=69791 RepID=UPI002546CB33|nr:uncharacterized protein N7481_013174 [Penicillium waksmanii]KAJ5966460.1 hypothetical protein N7481_013174 [Penicillium waksmanii]